MKNTEKEIGEIASGKIGNRSRLATPGAARYRAFVLTRPIHDQPINPSFRP